MAAGCFPIVLWVLLLGAPARADRVGHLIEQARSSTLKVRVQALYLLGKLRARRATGVLVAALGESDELIRATSAVALGKLGGSAAGNALMRAADDRSDWVRAEALRGLGEAKWVAAKTKIEFALMDDAARVRKAAQDALVKLREAAPGAVPRPAIGAPVRPTPASASSRPAAADGGPLLVVEVDDSFHVDTDSRPKTHREHCRRALQKLGRKPRVGQRWLYELAWKIKSSDDKEEAVEVVRTLKALGAAPLERARSCCAQMSADQASFKSAFTCLARVLGGPR